MTPAVARQLQKLDRTTDAMLRDLAGWTAERLQARPAPAAWSALEMLAHLCQVENAFIHMLSKASSGPATIKVAERVRAHVVVAVMHMPVRVKVPGGTPVEKLPGCKRTFAEARNEWLCIRSGLRDCLAQQVDLSTKKGVFRHPVSGWMTLHLAVSFLAAHCRHHQYQLKRLARGLTPPRP